MTKKEELEAQGYKTYENEDIQVFWKPRLCQHVGVCARGISIVFEEELDRAAAYDRGKLIGECEFDPSEKMWAIFHTGVREAYEGKGIARKLVLKVIEAARAKGVKISPICSYAKKMMAGKEEFKDVM